MDLSFLSSLYTRTGPFASVYADLTRTTEDASKAAELRWRALRERLEEQDCDPPTMRAVEDAVEEELRERRSEGLVVFAAGGEIAHLDRLPSTPAEHAEYAPLPHVLPYLVQRGERFAYVVVTVDRRGGEVTCVTASGERSTVVVPGDEEYPIHKTKAGDWNQSRFQRAAEEVWKANAKKVARSVDRCVRQAGAEAILVIGDPQVRGALLEEIADLDKVVETADPDGVMELKTVERVTAVTARFEHELAHGQRAVTGLLPTVEAVRRGQVETLLLAEDSTDRLWVGADPQSLATDLNDLHRMGVPDPVEERADAALIRAAAATHADLIVLPKDPPFGAVLRYADEATVH